MNLKLKRLGNELLSPVLRRSIIAAEDLNGRVRDGIACFLLAITTKPVKLQMLCFCSPLGRGVFLLHRIHCIGCFIDKNLFRFLSGCGVHLQIFYNLRSDG